MRYVCDMAEGYDVMSVLMSTGADRAAAFREAFGYDFKKSTWHDNLKAWESSDQADRDRFVGYGRRAEGEWTAFRRATGV